MKRTLCTTLVFAITLAAGAALADKWQQIKSEDYGIKLSVPDRNKCQFKESDEGAGMYCTDPSGMKVVAMAFPGKAAMSELRDAAHEYSEIPEKYWKKQGTTRDENGYKLAEAWSASHGGASVVALVGQSGKRKISHVVFLWGPDKAWKKHAKEIARFIDGIFAI